jgi:hypothetical protein
MRELTALINDLEQRRNAVTEALIGGSARDYAEYRNMCGEIRGLSYAHANLTDLVRKLEEDE